MWKGGETYKVDTDDELRFASVAALDLCQVSLTVLRALQSLGRVAVAGLLHRVAWRRRLLVHGLRVLRGVWVTAAGVDGWRGHGRVGPALVRML
jgi:hypothetical protein